MSCLINIQPIKFREAAHKSIPFIVFRAARNYLYSAEHNLAFTMHLKFQRRLVKHLWSAVTQNKAAVSWVLAFYLD